MQYSLSFYGFVDQEHGVMPRAAWELVHIVGVVFRKTPAKVTVR